MSNSLPEAMINCVIDNRYIVNRFLAAGGFGWVYEAGQQIMGHHVRSIALKVMINAPVKNESVVDSIKDALVVAALAEKEAANEYLKHLVHVYDIGVAAAWDNRIYIVMELLDSDLQMLLKPGGLPAGLAKDYTIQICKGMSLAHGQENPIVHRDLKPGNVLVDKAGTLKITDFGLAQYLSGSESKAQGAGDYFCRAPEALEGEASTRSDVYSIGLMMYEMFTGVHPMREHLGEDYILLSEDEQLERHKQARKKGMPDICKVAPSLRAHPDLVMIAERCVSPKPEDRFRDAGEVLAALEGNQKIKVAVEDNSDPIGDLYRNATLSYERGDLDQALAFITQQLPLLNENTQRDMLGEAWYLKGEIFALQKDYQAVQASMFKARDYGHESAEDRMRQLLLKRTQ